MEKFIHRENPALFKNASRTLAMGAPGALEVIGTGRR